MLNAPLPADATSPAQRRGLVMVVEDEPIIREFVCEILQFEGFETLDYSSADEAWEAFGEGVNVNLLITDIRMPGDIDGAVLTERVHGQWPSLPIIVMSGHETPETAKIPNEAVFVPKPWTIGYLTDQVIKAISSPECKALP